MKKYTMDDFVASKVAVRVTTKQNAMDFLRMCERRGLIWESGDCATGFIPRKLPCYIAFGIKGNQRLGFDPERYAPFYELDGFALIDFSDLFPDVPKDVDCRCANPAVPADAQKPYQVIIESDGTDTTAYMVVNGKTVKIAKARRNPEDKPNWKLGAELAFSRLWGGKKKDEKPRKKQPGVFEVGDRVVCIRKGPMYGLKGTILELHGCERVIVRFPSNMTPVLCCHVGNLRHE